MVKEDNKKKVSKTGTKSVAKKTSTKSTSKSSTKKATKPVTKSVATKEANKKIEKKVVSSEEENNYSKTILAAILVILVLVAGYIGYQIKDSDVDKKDDTKEIYKPTDDEKRFKDDYESINGKVLTDGTINKNVSILENNNISYISIDEAADIIKSGSGVIYFGYAADPWARNAVPVLLDAMESTNLEKIYYVDLRKDNSDSNDIRTKYEVVQKKIKKVSAPSSKYEDVLSYLDKWLDNYIITDNDGKEYDTGKKIINAPTVVAVKAGIVLDVKTGTLDDHKVVDGVLPSLTKDQNNKLFNIYASLINKYLKDGCSVDVEC